MNKIYILITAFIIIFFIFSCQNVKILNPNENDVEVFYADSIADDLTMIVEYKSKTNNGKIDLVGCTQFKIKCYENDFNNIYSMRHIHSNYLAYEQILIDNKDTLFALEFVVPFDISEPYIDYICVFGNGQHAQSWSNSIKVAIETNGKLIFDWDRPPFYGLPTNVATPFYFREDEFRDYDYLTDEENIILNFIIYTVKLYESLCTNGYLKNNNGYK